MSVLRARAHLREQLVQAVAGNPVSADDGWALIHAWDEDCCDIFWCPTVREVECGRHGGFDVCCAHPEKHVPLQQLEERLVLLCDIAEAAGKVLWEAQAGEVTDGSLALLDAELARLETASEPDAAAPSVCSRCAGTDPGCYICAQFKSPDAAAKEPEGCAYHGIYVEGCSRCASAAAKEPTDYLYAGCGCPQCRAETAGEEGT